MKGHSSYVGGSDVDYSGSFVLSGFFNFQYIHGGIEGAQNFLSNDSVQRSGFEGFNECTMSNPDVVVVHQALLFCPGHSGSSEHDRVVDKDFTRRLVSESFFSSTRNLQACS